jgi:hypothetical protein
VKKHCKNVIPLELADQYLTSFEDNKVVEQVENLGLWLMNGANDGTALSYVCQLL